MPSNNPPQNPHPPTHNPQSTTQATSISFDHSGTYFCAAAGKDITVGVVKAWTPLATLSGHSKDATGVCFSPDATSVVSTGMDRAVKFWGK